MSLAVSTTHAELAALRDRVASRLRAVRGRIRRRMWLGVAVRVSVAMAALGVASFVVDRALELSLPARIACEALAFAATAWIAGRSIAGVLRLRLEPVEMAAELDKARRSPPAQWIAPRVATVMQLSRGEGAGAVYSAAIADRAVRQSFQAVDAVDFARQLDGRHLRSSLIALAASLLAPVVFATLMPRELSSTWARRWLFGSNVGWPRDTSIEVVELEDGRLIVPRGEPAGIRVRVRDRKTPTETVWIRIASTDQPPETATMVKFGPGDFRFELPPAVQPEQAEFWGGDGRAGPIEIVPVDRPRIAAATLLSKHARDKTPQRYRFTGEEGNVRLLKDTAAELTLVANVALAALDVSAEGTAPPRFERIDERTYRARWVHQAALQLRVGMVSRDSRLASRPQPLSIGFREDRPPRVTLASSGVGARVTPMALIPLKVSARDDFAVARSSLSPAVAAGPAVNDRTEADRSRLAKLPPVVLLGGAAPGTEASFEGSHEWDLQPLKLSPGDVATVAAAATDDCGTGPQTSRSRTLTFRVVPPPELFREILLKQQQLRSRLRRALEQAELLRESLRAAVLAKDAEELLRRHNLLQREAWQVLLGIKDSALEMQLNRLGGPETHDVIARLVVKPLEVLHDDLLTRQRQGLESARDPGGESQQQLLVRQQEIIDAMSKILRNMAQWDSFIDVVNQLNEIIKLEQAVRERTEELKKKQFDSIFDVR